MPSGMRTGEETREGGSPSNLIVAGNPVHHLANVRQASAALGVFDPAPAVPPSLFCFDPVEKGRTAVGLVVPADVIRGVFEAVANQLM